MNKTSNLQQLLLKGFIICMVIAYFFSGVGTITTYALGDMKDCPVQRAVQFEEFCEAGTVFTPSLSEMKNGSELAQAVYYNFKSEQEYRKWLKTAQDAIACAEGSGITFEAKPKGLDAATNDNEETQAWAAYNTAVNKINGVMTRCASNNLTADVFSTESFDPTNAVVLGAMNTFSMWCNTLFSMTARAMFILFLVQTGFDCLYMTIDFMQPVLAPANSGSSTGSGNGVAKLPDWFPKVNLVSGEAIEAANKGTSGTSTSGGGISQSNTAIKYLMLRAPRFLLVASYLVLVVTDLWPRCISFVSALFTRVLTTIV